VLLLTGLAPAATYVGAEACRTCHVAEFDVQSRGGHAHALAPSGAGQPGDWAFGAGLQAITFLKHEDRFTYRELGETWYRTLNGYARTPGHKAGGGVAFRTFDPEGRVLRCFSCHSTGPSALGKQEAIEPHELGVRCEVCHGAGSDHARNPSGNLLRTPAQLSAAQMNTFCRQCHRLDLAGGEELTDLANPWILRSPTRLLAASACFAKSQGRLNCITCHAPHSPLQQDLAAYNAVCLRCHAAARHTQPVADQACAGCHMPFVRLDNLVFTNHRIATYGAASPLVGLSAAR
jgi:hypothetical protein